mmetsp:Transcript_14057/g.29060  ORF Transcript_14057/g.29060 Transcript_14057/m.29060 type:complete len:338 (-) Transcript_14057:1283-2296(-)
MTGWIILSLVISMSRFIGASTKYQLETLLDGAINNTATAGPPRTLPSMSREDNVRILNTYARHSVRAQSLSQELYGIIDFPEGDTKETFQEIYDEFVESYFTLRVDPKLVVESKITVTDVLVPPIANRRLRKRVRHLEILKDLDTKREGSRVIINYDQELSYYFPKDEGVLPLETLVTLPFVTDSGRNDFNLKLKESGDDSLQNIIGVSEVNLPPQNEPINSPTQQPPEPVSEPKPTSSPPMTTPAKTPTTLPTAPPSKRPTPIPIRITPSPSKQPVAPPSNPPTSRPTRSSTQTNPLEKNSDSGGISGLLIIGCLMVVLFIVFTINMEYCMGEYVD